MRSGGPREAIERFFRFVAGDANWEGLDRELRERIRASAGTWDVEPVRVADRDAPARPGVTQAPRDVRALLRRNELTGLPRRQRHCPFVAAGGLRRGLPLRLAAGPEEKSSRLVLSGAVARVAGRSDGSTLGSMTSGFADRDLAVFIDDLNAQRLPSAAEAGPAALRQAAEQRAAARPRGPEMHVVRDLFAPPGGRPARLYRPTPRATPLVLYLHGGGWVIGDLETHDRACRRLAFSSGVSVLALDYRRAPEHPWPAAVDDAVTALRWLASHPSELEMAPTAVAIAGDSAGGTIAALACVRMRDEAPEALPSVQATDLREHRSRQLRCVDGVGADQDSAGGSPG